MKRDLVIRDSKMFRIIENYSPHRTRRIYRPWIKPRVLLVHATVSSNASGTIAWLKDPRSKVSYDFVIARNGHIIRAVPHGWVSWHAGVALYKGKPRRDYNWLSLGVGLVNLNDGKDPYTMLQKRALAYVFALVQSEYPTVTRLRRHADVAYPLGRKTDPKGLSISDIYEAVKRWQPHVTLE